MCEKVKPNWRPLIFGIIVILGCAILGYLAQKNNWIRCVNIDTEQTEVDNNFEVNNTYVRTIEEVLQERRDMVAERYYDSVFVSIPETSLIAILIRYGTEMSNTDISMLYLQDRNTYSNVELGAEIYEEYIQKKVNEPDTIPRKAENDAEIGVNEELPLNGNS